MQKVTKLAIDLKKGYNIVLNDHILGITEDSAPRTKISCIVFTDKYGKSNCLKTSNFFLHVADNSPEKEQANPDGGTST